MKYLDTSCCGYIALRKGALAIGCVSVIFNPIFCYGVYTSGYLDKIYSWKSEPLSAYIYELLVIIAIWIQLIVALLLLWGTIRGSVWFMVPWIIFTTLLISGLMIAYFGLMVKAGMSWSLKDAFGYPIVLFLLFFPTFGLPVYSLLIIVSHFHELRKAKRSEFTSFFSSHSTPNHLPSYSSTVNAPPNVPVTN